MATIDEQVAGKKTQLDHLRPLTRESAAALAQWYDVELTYTSNAIEGNTLTRIETAIVLEKGITVAGKSLRDHMEAIGHKDALDYIHNLAQRNEPIREMDIRQIHSLVVGRSDPEHAGSYSPHQRVISGSPLVLPSPAEIGPLMGDFARRLSEATPSAETAFAAHEKLVTIHPFTDGNGRAARLLMNLVLFKAGYPPVVIGPEQRQDYISGLEAFQIRKDPEPYRKFMTTRLEAGLDHHISFLSQGLKPLKSDFRGP
jgi:Fic family protein